MCRPERATNLTSTNAETPSDDLTAAPEPVNASLAGHLHHLKKEGIDILLPFKELCEPGSMWLVSTNRDGSGGLFSF